MTLQDLILKLSDYWAAQGCLIQQPLDIEMGAGTMHPETFLRVLGPQPWNVAYVQPSRRPADGRFGENPNRLFKHHQFQVILKPAPDDVQDLYLQSLEACGIDLRAHDVRFEEDNWESPTLGAWGIGWQVHVRRPRDHAVHLLPAGRRHESVAGVRGADVRPRALRDVAAGRRQRVRPAMGAGRDVSRRPAARRNRTVEICVWPGERCPRASSPRSIATCSQRNYDFAQALLDSGLVLPALDYCLKCSHLFNVLDASGSIGVTERTGYILRVRQLAVAIANAWLGPAGEPKER